jgi:type I restriction enzyme R subunit
MENLPNIKDSDDIPDAFDRYWNEEQRTAFKKLCEEENLSGEKVEKIIEGYLFAEREPLRDEVLDLIDGKKPGVLERKTVGDRIMGKIMQFVETFISGISG